MAVENLRVPVEGEAITARVKHDLRRRRLTVRSVLHLTSRMVRITLEGSELDGFLSAAPDDHIKLFFPASGDKPEMRDFTPRHYDAAAGTLVVDFMLHEGGPAGSFAAAAKIGDTLEISGPRGSLIVSSQVKRWVLVGDETALPAIGRRIEELGAGHHVQAIIAVADAHERQTFDTLADLHLTWVHRDPRDSNKPDLVLAALRDISFEDEAFVWVGAEATVARAVRDYVMQERGHPKSWMRASGYWQMGQADAHETLD
jgi:NADPH-dependent ferric siderophore reductase